MALLVRDTRVIIPALRDGAPSIGAMDSMVVTGAGQYFTEAIDVGTFTEGILFLRTTAHSGSGPTNDIRIQYSPDGKNFIDSGDALTQVTTTDSLTLKKLTTNFGKYIRLGMVLGGTTPSYTISVYLALKG